MEAQLKNLKPGQFIIWEKHPAQVVWVGTLNILRAGNIENIEAVCLYLMKKHRYKTLLLGNKKHPFKEFCTYAKHIIGKEGL